VSHQADLLVTGCGQLLTMSCPDGLPRVGDSLSDIGLIRRGALASFGGKIVCTGAEDDVRKAVELAPDAVVIDAGGAVVMPGFVDCHTHAVFARYRLDEYEWRVAGTPYAEIAARGGGIAKSVSDVRRMPEDELFAVSRRRLDGCLQYGSTTVEIKSGYGLDLENELKQLRVIRRLSTTGAAHVVPTFLGAHALPEEYVTDREAFLRVVMNEMIPAVCRQGLAEYIDVFCETDVITPDEAERILRAGQRAGLGARIHADELNDTGSAALAARIGAVSADHLTKISPRGIRDMARTGVFGVLLPGTSFGLPSLQFAPAREMVERGMRVAIATDFNPGSSTCESMPMMIAIACSHLRLSAAEALNASTYNASFVVGRNGVCGSLDAGKHADFLILDCGDYREIPNRFGVNPAAQVWVAGRRWREGQYDS